MHTIHSFSPPPVYGILTAEAESAAGTVDDEEQAVLIGQNDTSAFTRIIADLSTEPMTVRGACCGVYDGNVESDGKGYVML